MKQCLLPESGYWLRSLYSRFLPDIRGPCSACTGFEGLPKHFRRHRNIPLPSSCPYKLQL